MKAIVYLWTSGLLISNIIRRCRCRGGSRRATSAKSRETRGESAPKVVETIFQ
jgi:hypothetical protein